jgi:3-deoxy-manno-octulosonate cytidylyltransferase (CMP-KDO synthetase)
VVMTSTEHRCGSDRIAEAVRARGLHPDTIVVNVQGDEPLLPPSMVLLVAQSLDATPGAGVATLATPLREPSEVSNPNAVKVVCARSGFALYFSRASIPHSGASVQQNHVPALRHIGLYAYRVSTLCQLAAHGPVALEAQESLEQLRALWLGIGIHVHVVEEGPPHGVDTQEDLARVVERVRSEPVPPEGAPALRREPAEPR